MTPTSVTASSEAGIGLLQCMPCIRYAVQFQNNKIQALIDSGSEVNTMTPAYATKLGLTIRKISVKAQMIDGLPLKTYGMVSARFLLPDSLERVQFFEETFLLADTCIVVFLGMPILALSNADFQFGAKKLTWRSYTAAEALSTTSRVELIDKTEFAKVALDENSETFLVHVTALELLTAMPIPPSRAL